MATAYKNLGQVVPAAPGTMLALYTVPAVTQAVVSAITVCNQAAVDATFRISIQVAGAADSPKQYIAYDEAVFANDSMDRVIGLTLGAGDIVMVTASAVTVSFNLSGSEIS